MEGNTDRPLLMEEKASLAHIGTWKCEDDYFYLVVVPEIQKLTLLVNGRRYLSRSLVTVREGEPIKAICAVILEEGVSEETDMIRWTVFNDTMTLASKDVASIDSEGREHLSSSLDSFLAEKSDSGELISCNFREQILVIELLVEYQPEFTLDREPKFGSIVIEKMTVKLSCQVEAVPESTPYWLKDGHLVSNSSILFFPNVSLSDQGWYQCSTSHKFGNFSSVGLYLSVSSTQNEEDISTSSHVILLDKQENSEILSAGQNQDVVTPIQNLYFSKIGEPVTLSFRICSIPTPSHVIWAGPRVLLKKEESNDRFKAYQFEVHGDYCVEERLDIESVKETDVGEYVILVRNDFGVYQGTIWLQLEDSDTSFAVKTCLHIFFMFLEILLLL